MTHNGYGYAVVLMHHNVNIRLCPDGINGTISKKCQKLAKLVNL